jgi:sterol desaturase/sphingolipid hydroxylase (fatty acid hydroxylase superfamily)
VLPPPFALIICTLAYPALRLLHFPHPLLEACFWSGYLIGYVLYDSTHYFLHFLDTSRRSGTYFGRLQKYHNQHHYGGEHAGFGVSFRLWDIVFRSEYKEKRVKKAQ